MKLTDVKNSTALMGCLMAVTVGATAGLINRPDYSFAQLRGGSRLEAYLGRVGTSVATTAGGAQRGIKLVLAFTGLAKSQASVQSQESQRAAATATPPISAPAADRIAPDNRAVADTTAGADEANGDDWSSRDLTMDDHEASDRAGDKLSTGPTGDEAGL